MNLFFSLFNRNKKTSFPVQVCNAKVQWVAEVFGEDLSEFRARAAKAADDLGKSSIEPLSKLFHSEHTPPPELEASFSGLGQWIAARQFAIFEIFYNYGQDAIFVLKRVAFGDYDWTQGNAIEILCRLAADSVNRTEIIDSLIENLPDIREEAVFYALGPLLYQAKTNLALADVISELLVVPEFKQAYDELNTSNA